MEKHAFLLGSAPKDFFQKKLIQFHEKLISDGGYKESEVAVFPNGINELLLEFALNNAIEQDIENILVYICTASPVSDSDESVHLGGTEIRTSIIEYYAEIVGGGFQAVFDSCGDFIEDL